MKQRTYVKNLSDDQIREMFIMRSKGVTLKRIGEKFGLSQETGRRVLVRKIRAEVEVPNNIIEKANELKQGQSVKRPRKSCMKSRVKAMADFGEAVMMLDAAETECMKHGLTKESLDLLSDSLRGN